MVTFLFLFFPLIRDINLYDWNSEKVFLSANLFLFLHKHFWPVVILSLIVICLHSIFISHKIAGPLYRFNLIFKTIKGGCLPQPTALRKGDYLSTEMEVINEMVESLRYRVIDIQQAQALLSQSIAELQEVAGCGSQEAIMERIQRLAESGKQFADKLGAIQLEP